MLFIALRTDVLSLPSFAMTSMLTHHTILLLAVQKSSHNCDHCRKSCVLTGKKVVFENEYCIANENVLKYANISLSKTLLS